MASGVTAYQTTAYYANWCSVEGGPGYEARIRVHYTTSRASASTVTAKLDVEVYYPGYSYASTNACAVFLDGSGTGQKLNQTYTSFKSLGTERLYASSPATKSPYTGSAGVWVTKTYSVAYNSTSFTVKVYFYNRLGNGNPLSRIWEDAKNYVLTFTIPCEVGYTSAGNPGAPTRSAQWFEGKCSFSWSAAANGTNNSVTGYDWIIDRSSSAGGTSGWTQIASGSTSSGTRSCTSPSISTAYRGYNFRCRVKTKATYGSYSYKNGTSYSRYNYSPTIGSTFLSFSNISGDKVHCGSSVTAKGGSDSGGYSSGSTLKYNLSVNGTWQGTQTSSSNATGYTWTSKLTGYGGTSIPFKIQVSDGFVTVSSSTKTYKIGQSLTNSFSFGSGVLTHDTAFSVPRSYIDGYTPYTSATETIKLSAGTSSTNLKEIYSGTRTGSLLTSSISIDHIYGRLYQNEIIPYLNQTSTTEGTVYFSLTVTIGHLSKTITGQRTYKNWVITNALFSPDNSNTYKFPFNSQIPVTTSLFNVKHSISSYPSGELTTGRLRFTIYYRTLNSSNAWTQLSQSIYNTTSTGAKTTIFLSSFFVRGAQIEIRTAWQWQNNETWYTIADNYPLKWDYSGITNTNDQKTIYYRPYPTLYLSSTSFTDAQMLTPNVAENRIAWDTSLTMEDDGRLMKIKKAYLTVYELDQEWDSAEIPLNTIIGSGGSNMELSYTYSNWYRITDNIDNNLQYHRLSYSLYNEDDPNVENGGENESAAFNVNGSYRLVQAFDFCELYRATPTGTLSDTLYESDLRTHNVLAELSFDMTSIPYFDATDSLTWSRYDYNGSN